MLGQNLFSDCLSIISHSRNLEGLYIGKLYKVRNKPSTDWISICFRNNSILPNPNTIDTIDTKSGSLSNKVTG